MKIRKSFISCLRSPRRPHTQHTHPAVERIRTVGECLTSAIQQVAAIGAATQSTELAVNAVIPAFLLNVLERCK